MNVIVAGTGKLAGELLGGLGEGWGSTPGRRVTAWADVDRQASGPCIVVHAGSGRELDELLAYCQRTRSVFVELATGTDIANRVLDFPVVLCPNTNVLMLKFMAMLAASGQLFAGERKQLIESHQADKTSTPGTAVSLARSLGMGPEAIVSVRDAVAQEGQLKIPAEHLARHALHRIVIEDGQTSITLETRVFGQAPYAAGLARIIAAIEAHALEDRCHDVVEFVGKGWL